MRFVRNGSASRQPRSLLRKLSLRQKTIANASRKEGTLRRGASKLTDLAGREFGSLDMEGIYVPKPSDMLYNEKIQPSLSRDFYTIFEVPADATGLSFKVSDFTGSSTRLIALGTIPAPAAAPPPVAQKPSAAPAAKPAVASAAKAKAAPAKK